MDPSIGYENREWSITGEYYMTQCVQEGLRNTDQTILPM